MAAYPGDGLGQRLKMARARRQQTQAEAAKAAGVSRSVWSQAEHDGHAPEQAAVLGRLALYLDCDPADLIGGGSSVAGDATQADEPYVATASSAADEVSDGE